MKITNAKKKFAKKTLDAKFKGIGKISVLADDESQTMQIMFCADTVEKCIAVIQVSDISGHNQLEIRAYGDADPAYAVPTMTVRCPVGKWLSTETRLPGLTEVHFPSPGMDYDSPPCCVKTDIGILAAYFSEFSWKPNLDHLTISLLVEKSDGEYVGYYVALVEQQPEDCLTLYAHTDSRCGLDGKANQTVIFPVLEWKEAAV